MTYEDLSKYQKAIVDYFEKYPYNNMYISALAGSAKTTMALFLAGVSSTKDVYVAFNKDIRDEFSKKVKKVKKDAKNSAEIDCFTSHSLGFHIMKYNWEREHPGKILPNERKDKHDKKISGIVDKLFPAFGWTYFNKIEEDFLKKNIIQLYSKVRVNNYKIMNNPDLEWQINLAIRKYKLFQHDKFERPPASHLALALKYIYTESLLLLKNKGEYNYEEMITVTLDKLETGEWVVPPNFLYCNIYCDEAQDLNNVQLNLLKYIRKKNGRYIFILDKNQAIYGWNGANCNSYRDILDMYKPIEQFELPVNYRCPISHLEYVKKICGIEMIPRDDAPVGVIKKRSFIYACKCAEAGDLVIARKNADLMSMAYELIKIGKEVKFENSELEKAANLIVESKKNKTGVKEVHDLVEIIRKEEKARAKNITGYYTDNASKIDKIDDTRLDELRMTRLIINCYEYKVGSNQATFKGLKDFISAMFSDKKNENAIRLMSIHKAKGLEAERVYVLNEAKPLEDPRMDAETALQEKNLTYVALTRSTSELYLVGQQY